MAKEFVCPECQESFVLDSYLDKGDIFECPGCSVELRVVSASSAEVEVASDFEDDYSEETEDDEEDGY